MTPREPRLRMRRAISKRNGARDRITVTGYQLRRDLWPAPNPIPPFDTFANEKPAPPTEDERDIAVRIAEGSLLAEHETLFQMEYALGVSPTDLDGLLEAWARDIRDACAVLEKRPHAGIAYNARSAPAIWSITEFLIRASLLGHDDLVRAVLRHPLVARTPYRPLDLFAAVHEVARGDVVDEFRAGLFEDRDLHLPLLHVSAAGSGKRQAVFEKAMDAWDETRERWAWVGALIAIWFGLDDTPVRDHPAYPVDMVDMARGRGITGLPDGLVLPGPWTRPAPPAVLEPAVLRAAHAPTGAPSLGDLAAIASATGEPLAGGTLPEIVASGIAAGTIVMLDHRGIDVRADTEAIQGSCAALGLRAPGATPTDMPTSTEAGIARFDGWLATVGTRLHVCALDSDDTFVVPMLDADHRMMTGV